MDDTITAIATPQGSGAIGVIRLSGPKAIEITQSIFSDPKLQSAEGNTLHYGTIRDSDMIIDEVLVSLFRAPRSYTGEDSTEISCHGSAYILEQILMLVINKGARLAEPGEFTQRAYLHGKLKLSQAEAVADLIASENQSAHDIALRQMRGGYTTLLQDLRQQLIDFTALIELELDFSEEDVEFANRSELEQLITSIQLEITQLIDSFAYGNAIKEGIPVVIAGKPNAGKSSLLNALLQEEKAIVSDIAGTTRDSIEDVVVLDGAKFRLTDTAGLRDTEDTIEAIGVQRAQDKISQAQILIYLYNWANTSPQEIIEAIESFYRPDLHILLAQTHRDLYTEQEYATQQNQILETLQGKYHSSLGLALSGQDTTQSIDTLKNLLSDYVHNLKPQSSSIVSNQRHLQALQLAQKSLQDVQASLQSGISGDLLAQDIRHALHYIGSITGEIDVDQDILGTIFGRFCIGK